MENNFKPASEKQLETLRKLGIEPQEGLTSFEASAMISEKLGNEKKNGTAQQQQQAQQYNNYNNYGAPQQAPQQQYNNYSGYNQAPVSANTPIQNQYGNQSATHQQNSQNSVMVADNSNYTVTTRTGEEILISPEVINMYIGAALTQPEFQYFFAVCKNYGLNPFLKDIYPIKFGNQPVTFVIDYKVMQQAADEEPSFDGLKVGLIFLDSNGNFQEREGAFLLPNEKLIGAWCDVFRKDRTHTNRTYALYNENVKRKSDGSITTMWKDKPVFMITKVAKAQALRETFPNMFSNNTYTSEEMPETRVEVINAEDSKDYEEKTLEGVRAKQASQNATIQVDENGEVIDKH